LPVWMEVHASGTILTSSNGSSWSVQVTGVADTLRDVIWNGSWFVAVGDNGTILTSGNGSTWTKQTSGTTRALYGVAGNGERVVAGGRGIILTSTDGVTWTERDPGVSSFFIVAALVWNGKRFIAADLYGQILSSEDGIDWLAQNSVEGINVMQDIACDGQNCIGVGDGGTVLRLR